MAVIASIKRKVEAWFAAARAASQPFDHLVRALSRYSEQQGDRLAGAVTYFGFLSFFPLLAVAFAILAYVVVVYPEARQQVTEAVEASFPGLIGSGPGKIDLSRIAGAGIGAGVVGLLGLVYSGTGWIDALRDALRTMWLQPRHQAPNILLKKAWDLVVLAVFGVALVASVSFSSLATSATRWALTAVDLHTLPGLDVALRVLAVVVAVAFDAALLAVLFVVLPGVRTPLPVLVRGAVLGAVGFEVLKLLGTFLIGRTTSNPVYGAFALTVGLLVWINLVARVTVFAAAWTATALPAEAEDEEQLPAEVAARLEELPVDQLRRRLDCEALLYREQAWLAKHAIDEQWPAEQTAQVRGNYVRSLVERLQEAGFEADDLVSPTRPGTVRDLLHQYRVANRARRYTN
ncbi:MAG: hypothetical protein GEV07_08770 [Streptosporangiales bacterium]|nr:hypothetical protein [Streptosporangiales bacterium]